MDEVIVFTALYHGANPKSPAEPDYEQANITFEEGAQLLKWGDDFVDYIPNRRLKFRLQELIEGAAERAIANILRV
jgi:hypothetical protein